MFRGILTKKFLRLLKGDILIVSKGLIIEYWRNFLDNELWFKF